MIDKDSSRTVRSITIACTPDVAYSYWRDLQRLPEFMTSVEQVSLGRNGVTHWRVGGPAGTTVEWDAVVTMDEPNHVITWKSLDGTRFDNAGSVRFESVSGGNRRGETMVTVTMHYDPAGGSFTSAISKLFGVDVGQKVTHDLRNLKQLIEVGEITQSDASIHRSMHPARPAEDFAAPVRLRDREPEEEYRR